MNLALPNELDTLAAEASAAAHQGARRRAFPKDG
jgi:hypothetical protein